MSAARFAASCLLLLASSASSVSAGSPRPIVESSQSASRALRTPSGRALGWDGRALPAGDGPRFGRATTPLGIDGALDALDGRWNELGPPVRLVPRMIFDAAHGRLVVFGGVSGAEPSGYRYVDDTWVLALDGPGEWQRLEVAGPRPEPRAGHGAVYDAARHRLVIFGGFRFAVREDDTLDFRYMSDAWALSLDGTPRWERLAANGPQPDPRTGPALAYDGARDRVLAIGGYNSYPDDGTYFDELWALDLSRADGNWALLPKAARGPEPRAFALAARDEVSDQLVFFGGQSAYDTSFVASYHRDVWTLGLASGGPWQAVDPSGPLPRLRFAEASAWNQKKREIAFFGGVLVDTLEGPHLLDDSWVFDLASARWTQGDTAAAKPEPRESASLACDGQGNAFLFSGDTEVQAGLADTWQWSHGAWLEHAPGAPLSRRFGVAAEFDEASRTVFAFGGRWVDLYLDPYENQSFAYDDLQAWSVDRGSWSRPEAQGTSPSARSDAATAFDPARRRMWILGGTTVEGRSLDDTWALELDGGPRWREVPASGPHPAGRDRASAVFDARDDRVILYGGVRGESEGENEVWQLRDDAWSLLTVQGVIPPRLGAMAVYDSKRHRMIVLGGAWYDKFDTWALSLDEAPAWSRIDGGGQTPPPGAGARAVYDPGADRVLVFGGIDSGNLWATDANVYALSLADPPAWRRLEPAGQAALPRSDHLAFFDLPRNRLLVTGGWDGFSSQNGSFELSFAQAKAVLTVALDVRPGTSSNALAGRARSPLPVALLSAPDFDPARVDVASLRLEGAPARVSARQPSDWNADGTTDLLVEFDPALMQPHGERLTLTGALLDGTPIVGTAIVSVRPRALAGEEKGAALAIRALGTAGTMRFAASVPSGGAWSVELFDVRGRRMGRSAGVAEESGEFAVELAGSPPSGVYFVRLNSGKESTRTRIAWTRR